VKSKIRENSVLERFVSDMLLSGYSFRDVEKSARERLRISVSRETIRKYFEEVFLPRFTLSPPSKTETWKALLDLDEVMGKSVTKSEVEMLRYQVQAVSLLEENLKRLHEATASEISASQLNAISRATMKLIKAQWELYDHYQNYFDKQKRHDAYKHRVLEELQVYLSSLPSLSPHDITDIINLTNYAMRDTGV